MATAYISEKIDELGGLYKFGICYGRDFTKDRFYSMYSKHDFPKLEVKKEIVVDKEFVPLLRQWEKEKGRLYESKKNTVYRKKHIYTIIGERQYDFIGERDGAANGGTEFYLLTEEDVKLVMTSLDKLKKKCK